MRIFMTLNIFYVWWSHVARRCSIKRLCKKTLLRLSVLTAMAQIEKKMRHRRGCGGCDVPNPMDSPLGPGPGRFLGSPLEPYMECLKIYRSILHGSFINIQYTCTEKCTIYAHIMLTLDDF